MGRSRDPSVCPVSQAGFWRTPLGAQLGLNHTASLTQSPAGFNSTEPASRDPASRDQASPAAVLGWLIGLEGCHVGEDFRLCEGITLVGAGWDCGAILTAPGMSLHHAEIFLEARKNGKMTLRDLTDRSAVKLNGEFIGLEEEPALLDGDELELSGVRFLFRIAQQFQRGYQPILRPRPPAQTISTALERRYLVGWLVAQNGPHVGQDFRVVFGNNYMGRGFEKYSDRVTAGVEICLGDQNLAARHAVIRASREGCFLKPCDPLLQVCLQGQRIDTETRVVDSDVISIGEMNFVVKTL